MSFLTTIPTELSAAAANVAGIEDALDAANLTLAPTTGGRAGR